MIGKKILAFLLMRKKIFGLEARFRKQIYDHNENSSPPPSLPLTPQIRKWLLPCQKNKFTTTMKIPAPLYPTDKKMVVALLKIMIHEYLFVFFFNYNTL